MGVVNESRVVKGSTEEQDSVCHGGRQAEGETEQRQKHDGTE